MIGRLVGITIICGLLRPVGGQQLGGVPHAQDGFRFAVISDIQIREPEHRFSHVARQMFDDLSRFEERPAFVIATGDLVDGRSGHSLDCPGNVYDAQYEELFELLGTHLHPAIKLYPVVGNHDYHRASDSAPSGPEKFAQRWFDRIPFGVSPRGSPYYSFDHGNTHFAVVCTGLFGVKKVNDFDDLVHGEQYEWL